MADKPTVLPKWAEEDATDPTSGQPNVSEPPEAKKDSGFERYDVPPRQWINWLARLTYRWILWAKEEIEGILSTAVFQTRQVIAGRGLSGGGDLSADRTVNTYRYSEELSGSTKLLTSNYDGVYHFSSGSLSYTFFVEPQTVDEGATETVLICRDTSDFTMLLTTNGGVTVVWSFDESESALGYEIKPGETIRLVKVATNSYVAYADNGISERVELGGDFNAEEEVTMQRNGNQVTITGEGILDHVSSSSPASASGAIPSLYRPTGTSVRGLYGFGVEIYQGSVSPIGDFNCTYRDFSGASAARTNTGSIPSITYNIASNIE